MGPLDDSVPSGVPDHFWAVRDANQDLAGTTFLDLSLAGQWSSSDPTIATIDNTGTAATHHAGTTIITFKSGPFVASTTLTVTPAVISFITVTPANPTVSLGGTRDFTAIATLTDNTTQDVTGLASWSADDITVVTTSGRTATGVAAGSTFVNATYQSVTGFTGINSGMTCLTLSPTNPDPEPAGGFIGFTATGYFGAGPGDCATSPNDVSNFVNWSSSNTTVATVDGFGFATALSAGTATITAASPPLTASTTMTVSPPTLDFVEIQPASDATIPEGGVQAYKAIGTYSDSSTQDLTNAVTWISSDPTVATISSTPPNSGIAQAHNNPGGTQISLTLGGCTGLCPPDAVNLSVVAPVLQSITVSPASSSIANGTNEQFTATGNYSFGPPQDLTGSVSWSSDTTSVATINNSGLAFSVGTGSTTIAATLGQISGAATLTVTPAKLNGITITPTTPPAIKTAETVQFTAIGHYTDSSTSDITNSVTWQSTTPSVATINSSGLATAVTVNTPGSTTIQASSGGVPSSNSPTLSVAVLQTIGVTPGSPAVTVGGTQQFTATGTYSDLTQQDLTASVAWQSDHTNVAVVCDVTSSCSNKGQAQALAQGSASVTAVKSGVASGPVSLTVNTNSATLQSITIAPLHSFVVANQTRQYSATGHYSDGSTRNLTALVSWSSSKTSIATINNAGLATGKGPGTCTITATITLDGSHSASTDLTVSLF
jgi:uncharacterized protein YjdB